MCETICEIHFVIIHVFPVRKHVNDFEMFFHNSFSNNFFLCVCCVFVFFSSHVVDKYLFCHDVRATHAKMRVSKNVCFEKSYKF